LPALARRTRSAISSSTFFIHTAIRRA
jgi:hypothetical protein